MAFRRSVGGEARAAMARAGASLGQTTASSAAALRVRDACDAAVVGDDDARHPNLLQNRQNDVDGALVEVVGRLVQQEQLRPPIERAGDEDALLLPPESVEPMSPTSVS